MHTDRLLRLSSLFAASAALAVLSACGGGGSGTTGPAGSGSPTPAPAPAPAPSEPPPVLSVPTPTYSTTSELLAIFNKINALRTQAGLGLLAQNARLDQAAQAHAQYNITNNAVGHFETAGKPGFTGVASWDRIAAAGYTAGESSEVSASGPLYYGSAHPGADMIDTLTCVPYHRLGILAYSLIDVGVGLASTATGSLNLVADMARPSTGIGSTGQGAVAPFLVWPTEGSTGNMARPVVGEVPNPVPELGSAPWGCAVSVHVNRVWRNLSTTSFVLYDSTGATVPTKLLTYATDTNLQSYNDTGVALLVPLVPLTTNATYTASFSGGYRLLSAAAGVADTPIKKTWSFTTGAR